MASLWRELRLMSLTAQVAKSQRERFHKDFQFLWMDEVETVSSIAMSFLSAPVLLVMETNEQVYYMTPVSSLTTSSLVKFLTNIRDGKEKAYGGTGFLMRLWRLVFDILTTVLSIWQASRWLFLLMFGLPTLIISVICYSLCCMETVDDDFRDEDEYDSEEENEQPPPPPLPQGSSEPPSYDEVVQETASDPKEEEDKKND